MTGALWELFFKGVWITVQLTVYSAALAAAVAFGVGIARTSRLRVVRFLSGAYVEIFRGTSALVLMFWLFFALPLLGWQLAGVWAGTLALGLSYGAYGSEVVRGALGAVAPAQREAAIALSFTPWQRMRKVFLSQALPEMMPPFTNLLIELLKCTALASLLSIGELTFEAKLARLSTGESAQVYGIILVLYFVIAFVVTRIMRLAERRAKASVGRAPEISGGLFSRTPAVTGTAAPAAGGGKP
ncbi:ectoine/hydroxyectoine ABC transporter permease subunit EhuC [Streptomyces benahoarensis]|uniref:Ectoine/hydroxyectoine ABC transporter permease subunit EhuC n=1 Tax=Streptomyces benahoarensis TaxID=2595054 RepID=A0A553ZK79_9ACTN|nr:ectoine/hydroxyectoine ABC transporter permease subunit EhuC [Streptomyces benahoarensis]TSB19900.1 ectoine/hydroxyectoine ABC transporter permease subunit EhuC [Streptomyces benahoarensis]TSB41817.1 ectoine/hydroxyectoine ABC transporter permease subunit EhuC [Streptomyces benahoarensis]